MKKRFLSLLTVLTVLLAFAACGNTAPQNSSAPPSEAAPAETSKAAGVDVADAQAASGKTDLADNNFDTSYKPKKDTYKIYCTYKLVHSWYDAIEAGVKAAVDDFAAKGVTIDYEWYAPVNPDAVDQGNSIETAVGQGWDLIAVDVNQEETTAPAINAAVAAGVKVATFASSDIPGSDRTFFVGNTDNRSLFT